MKTLADLKRDLKVGVELILLERFGQTVPIAIGKRTVAKIQSNGIYLGTGTKNSWLGYPKASQLEYDGKTIKIFEVGERELTKDEKDFLALWETKRDKEQETLDALSDGSTSFYQKVYFFKENGYEYLLGHNEVRGLRYNWNNNTVRDNAIKGKVELVYELVKNEGVI